MEGTQSKKTITEMLCLLYLAITLILTKTYSYENMGERPTEGMTKIYRKAINYSTYGTIEHVHSNMVISASFGKEQKIEVSFMKINSPVLLMSSWLMQYEIKPTLLLSNRISELTPLPDYSAAAFDISSIRSDSRHRVKRNEWTSKYENGQPVTNVNHKILEFFNSKDSANQDTTETRISPSETTDNETTGKHKTNSTTDQTTVAYSINSSSTDQDRGGWPMWVWIVIAVAVFLVIIAVIISIIVCINMNKSEETPASAGESAESLGSSESEVSEEEGERRLRRGRRQIAACSYCPQTLQRYGNDGPTCGRNCCNTELNEERNISNAL